MVVGLQVSLIMLFSLQKEQGHKSTKLTTSKRIPDEQMISPEKRPLSSPVSDRPSTKARPTRAVQTPASTTPPPVPPSNHLRGDDRLVFSPPVVQTPKMKKKPEDDELPEEEGAGDPDAQPSGHNSPIADDDELPVSPESPEAVIVDDDIPDLQLIANGIYITWT